ncbi:transcriptional adapter 3 isoform X2 [Coccinella septempunctata]|uniref:transcriptional adapter 3 isoform X2 n=1 Tax=Coccinella septempunctata TaxID=41139 RepID=UPI001D05EDBF|nr:transcriptional adapter 3 isoform X2 [Coccinella septempunctata]
MNGLSKNCAGKALSQRNFGKEKEEVPVEKSKNELIADSQLNTYTIPFIRISQNASCLAKYTNVLTRSSEDGITMDDLDALQQDLEKLLTNCALRNRFFRAEIESIDKVEEKRDKRGKQTSLKRKRQDDKMKFKDIKNGTRIVKKHGLGVNNFIVDTPPLRHDIPKVALPKNDTSEKFWASVEPFCAEIQKDDVAFLDTLIEECSKEITIKVPDIGEHFTSEWSDELLFEEQNVTSTKGNEFKKNGFSAILDSLSNPKTQSLLSTLPATLDKFRVSDLGIFKNYSRKGCMEKRLKKELIDQGILSVEDLQKTTPEDEVLLEIKKCQHELITVNEYNKMELHKLRNSVAKDMKRQEVKEALNRCDNKVMELYNKILLAKQKALQNEDEDVDKQLVNEQITKDFESEADSLVEQQYILNRELLDLTDASMLY